MSSTQILADLAAEVTRDTDVKSAAGTLISGFAARVQTAVDAALANGATEAQLQPVIAEVAAMKAGTDTLAQAIVDNTPAA